MEERVGKRRRCGVKEEKREGGCVEVVLGGGSQWTKSVTVSPARITVS